MAAIFAADQADRQARPIDWTTVAPRDLARQARTQVLLKSGALDSGTDYFHAAFVFQHGERAGAFLLAHTLAMIAVARGRQDALWIASASLDRYLQSVGQPQIYGTQYRSAGQRTTQQPYDRQLVSDTLRQVLGVPSQAAQERRRTDIETGAVR